MRHLTHQLISERYMSDDLHERKLLKYGSILYAIIFVLITTDVLSDYQEGIQWSHIIIELLVLIVAVIGLSMLGYAYYQNNQRRVIALEGDLNDAKAQAKHWQDESRHLIQGLAEQIKKQFERWQLTDAESQIGLLLLKGFSHQEIANLRLVSERTVREQARTLYRKAGLTSRAELSAFFLEDLLLPVAQQG